MIFILITSLVKTENRNFKGVLTSSSEIKLFLKHAEFSFLQYFTRAISTSFVCYKSDNLHSASVLTKKKTVESKLCGIPGVFGLVLDRSPKFITKRLVVWKISFFFFYFSFFFLFFFFAAVIDLLLAWACLKLKTVLRKRYRDHGVAACSSRKFCSESFTKQFEHFCTYLRCH